MIMIKYKCTYTLLEGVPCDIMWKYTQPHPSHCHAYDTTIWNINPKMTCEYCIQLQNGEIQEKKIWCDEMDCCDSYNDGGSKKCEDCVVGKRNIVFDLPKLQSKNKKGR
jgi:hypothetical protein